MEAPWTVELGESTNLSNSAASAIYAWFPDGHISVLPACRGTRRLDDVFWAEFETYRTVGMSQYPETHRTLRPDEPVIGKRGDWEGWDNGGSWLMSVHRLSGNELIGFYHAEDHWCCPPGTPKRYRLEIHRQLPILTITDLTWGGRATNHHQRHTQAR